MLLLQYRNHWQFAVAMMQLQGYVNSCKHATLHTRDRTFVFLTLSLSLSLSFFLSFFFFFSSLSLFEPQIWLANITSLDAQSAKTRLRHHVMQTSLTPTLSLFCFLVSRVLADQDCIM